MNDKTNQPKKKNHNQKTKKILKNIPEGGKLLRRCLFSASMREICWFRICDAAIGCEVPRLGWEVHHFYFKYVSGLSAAQVVVEGERLEKNK